MTLWQMAVCPVWTWVEGIIRLWRLASLVFSALLQRSGITHDRQVNSIAKSGTMSARPCVLHLERNLRANREAIVTSTKSLHTNSALKKGRGSGENWVPTDEMEDVYRSFIDRIGLLSQVEVRKVMNAYLMLRSYTAVVLLLSRHSRAPRPFETNIRHVPFSPEMSPKLMKIQESLIGPVDEAIDVLERARKMDTRRVKR